MRHASPFLLVSVPGLAGLRALSGSGCDAEGIPLTQAAIPFPSTHQSEGGANPIGDGVHADGDPRNANKTTRTPVLEASGSHPERRHRDKLT